MTGSTLSDRAAVSVRKRLRERRDVSLQQGIAFDAAPDHLRALRPYRGRAGDEPVCVRDRGRNASNNSLVLADGPAHRPRGGLRLRSASTRAAAFDRYKLANDGRDTRSLAHYLGHRNLESTARYTALALDRFKGFWQDYRRLLTLGLHVTAWGTRGSVGGRGRSPRAASVHLQTTLGHQPARGEVLLVPPQQPNTMLRRQSTSVCDHPILPGATLSIDGEADANASKEIAGTLTPSRSSPVSSHRRGGPALRMKVCSLFRPRRRIFFRLT
jgi:hypothetical protein